MINWYIDVYLHRSYMHGMEKRVQIGIKLPPSLLAELDEVLSAYEFTPSRTEFVEKAIRELIARSKKAARERVVR